MRLLFLTQKVDRNDDILGVYHEWIKRFAEKCESIIVICLQKGEYDLLENVKVLSLGKEKLVKHSVFNKGVYLVRFYRYIWKERKNYDTVFIHMNPEYILLGGLFWRLWAKRIGFWYAHGSVTLKLKIAEKLADKIFTSSKEGCGLRSDKIIITGQGINVERFRSRYKQNELQIHSDKEFLYSDLTYKIRGACFRVWKKFRGAFKEKIIERALIKELSDYGLMIESQKQIPIFYKDEKVGVYIPDIIVDNKVLIELKSKPFLAREDERQFWLYLQGSEYKLGLLVNFGQRLAIKRRIYDRARNLKERNKEADNQRVSASLDQRRSAYKIISVGRIAPIKHYEVLIEAAEILRNQGLAFSVEIAGAPILKQDEIYFEKLKTLIKEKNLEGQITFIGSIPNKDIVQFYQSGDLFVNLSQTGSMDKVVLEAMSCALPVLNSNPAYFSLLDKKYSTSNNPEELAQKIKYFIENRFNSAPELREIVVKKHNLENLIGNIAGILR